MTDLPKTCKMFRVLIDNSHDKMLEKINQELESLRKLGYTNVEIHQSGAGGSDVRKPSHLITIWAS